jgi:hypothetical protein
MGGARGRPATKALLADVSMSRKAIGTCKRVYKQRKAQRPRGIRGTTGWVALTLESLPVRTNATGNLSHALLDADDS